MTDALFAPGPHPSLGSPLLAGMAVALAFFTSFGGRVTMPVGDHNRNGSSVYGNVPISATPTIRATRRTR